MFVSYLVSLQPQPQRPPKPKIGVRVGGWEMGCRPAHHAVAVTGQALQALLGAVQVWAGCHCHNFFWGGYRAFVVRHRQTLDLAAVLFQSGLGLGGHFHFRFNCFWKAAAAGVGLSLPSVCQGLKIHSFGLRHDALVARPGSRCSRPPVIFFSLWARIAYISYINTRRVLIYEIYLGYIFVSTCI